MRSRRERISRSSDARSLRGFPSILFSCPKFVARSCVNHSIAVSASVYASESGRDMKRERERVYDIVGRDKLAAVSSETAPRGPATCYTTKESDTYLVTPRLHFRPRDKTRRHGRHPSRTSNASFLDISRCTRIVVFVWHSSRFSFLLLAVGFPVVQHPLPVSYSVLGISLPRLSVCSFGNFMSSLFLNPLRRE